MGDAAAVLLPVWTAAIKQGQLSSIADIECALRSQPLLQQAGVKAGAGQAGSAAAEFINAATQAASKATVGDAGTVDREHRRLGGAQWPPPSAHETRSIHDLVVGRYNPWHAY